jgi:hypothetical protein
MVAEFERLLLCTSSRNAGRDGRCRDLGNKVGQ